MRRIREVLLVDDNPADIDLTSEALSHSRFPHRVSTAVDGVEALAFLQRKGKYSGVCTPDLVILDLNLPRKDGRAVLAEIKSDAVLRTTPIVIFSASRASHDIARSYELGANSYVSKPGNLQDYLSTMTSLGDFWLGCACLPREEEH